MALGMGVVALAVAAGAFASTLRDVVRPHGQVAGHKYPYWLKRTYQRFYEAPAPGPKPCETVKVNGKSVVLVEDIRGGKISCHVPARHPIFVNELGRGCANIPGQHNGYGTSDYQLDLCAREVPQKALISEWLDGRRVRNPNYGRYFWFNARVFTVHVPAGRFNGFGPRRTHAAAWGWALLLKGLPKGTHTVRCKGRYPDGRFEFGSHVTLYVH
ncbi:MAG: hypothetical protein ACJ764_13565 [Solirubrobacteraceae bacterium]